MQWAGCRAPNAPARFPDAVEVTHIHVLPAYWRQGIGTQLVQAAEVLLRERALPQMVLRVADNNHRARRLYEALGFAPTGVFDVTEYDWRDGQGELHHESERDEVLVKQLTPAAHDEVLLHAAEHQRRRH